MLIQPSTGTFTLSLACLFSGHSRNPFHITFFIPGCDLDTIQEESWFHRKFRTGWSAKYGLNTTFTRNRPQNQWFKHAKKNGSPQPNKLGPGRVKREIQLTD